MKLVAMEESPPQTTMERANHPENRRLVWRFGPFSDFSPSKLTEAP